MQPKNWGFPELTILVQVHNPIESNLEELDLQKKIRKRNKKLQDHKIRRSCSDSEYENVYLWNSDPDRQGKEVYDSGEVHDLNKKYEREGVRRDVQKNCLFRVSTGNPVHWSDFEGKWIDIVDNGGKDSR